LSPLLLLHKSRRSSTSLHKSRRSSTSLHKSRHSSTSLHKSRRSSEGHLDKLLLPFVLLFHHLLLSGWRTWMDEWMERRTTQHHHHRTNRHQGYYISKWNIKRFLCILNYYDLIFSCYVFFSTHKLSLDFVGFNINGYLSKYFGGTI
jgi:hypothetical protein